MTKPTTCRSANVIGQVAGGKILALVLANLPVLLLVLIMAAGVVDDAGTYFDAEATFAKSLKGGQTATAAVINVLLFPFVLYLVYFMNFGKTSKQALIAGFSFLLTLMPCLAYLFHAVQPSLPGGYVDFQLVMGALLLLFFWGFLLLRTIARWRIIHPPPAKEQYPRCESCGYNLTGLTEARCPECGIPFDPKLLADQPQPSPPNEEAAS